MNIKINILFVVLCVLFTSYSYAQLDEGSVMGIPKGTTAEINAISTANVEEGAMVYNTDTDKLMLFNGVIWVYNESSSSDGWSLTGNSISNSDFLGSTNNQDLVFKTNNIESGRISVYQLSTVFGYNASSSYQGTAIGNETAVVGNKGVAVGYKTKANNQNSTVVGSDAEGNANQSTVYGYQAVVNFDVVNSFGPDF